MILSCGQMNFSGLIDARGANGINSTGNNVGPYGGSGGALVALSASQWLANTGTIDVTGGYGGSCVTPAIVFGQPSPLPAGVQLQADQGARAHITGVSGGVPAATATVDYAGLNYNYTPTCAVVGGGGSGASCSVTMAGSGSTMTVSAVTISGGTGYTYTARSNCGAPSSGTHGDSRRWNTLWNTSQVFNSPLGSDVNGALNQSGITGLGSKTVAFAPGTYTLTAPMVLNTTLAKNLTITSQSGGRAVFSSAQPITGWSAVGGASPFMWPRSL